MGSGLINIYRNKVKSEWKIAFIATVILGFLIHSYRFTNILLNHDALYNYYSSQNIVGSGRWFLSLVCGISSYYNLPWAIGVLSILFIALTTIVICEIFEIKNPVLSIIIGGILVSFPAITDTFYFEFTADGYMIAMFLSALAVRFALIKEHRIQYLVASGICICLACGIYQAYVSFALLLAVAYFITKIFEGQYSNKEYLIWIRNEIIIYAAAMIVYYVVWKLCMHFEHFDATTYLGIDRLGQMNIHNIYGAIYSTVVGFILFLFDWNIFEHGLTTWSAINIIFVFAACVVLITAIVKSNIIKRKLQFCLGILAVISMPFIIYLWYFSSASVVYSTRMLQSFALIYIMIAVLADRWLNVRYSTMVGAILAIFIFINGITANVFYYYMQRCNQQSYANAIEIATRIHELDDGTITKIAIGGGMDTWNEEEYINLRTLGNLGKLKSASKNLLYEQIHTCLYLDNELGFELSYYRMNKDIEIPEKEKEESEPVTDEWTFKFPMVSSDELSEITASAEYKDMPSWPAVGSVVVKGDTIIVKLSDVK